MTDPQRLGTSLPLLVAGLLAASTNVSARTIVLTEADCERMAVISADAPRMSWAAVINASGEYGNHQIDLTKKTSFLIRYPLDKIPADQRITKAEWVIPYIQSSPATGVRVEVRRLLVDWGAGVNQELRMLRPQKIPWHTPGALGVGKDRAVKATAGALLKNGGEQTFNVTEDVELWHSGTSPNYGWIVTTDDELGWIRTQSPFWNGAKLWKLRITFEPK